MLLSADYSQVELRMLAHVADEPVLKEIFVRGEDVHTATASQVFRRAARRARRRWHRSKAKMINYGIVYGLSDYGLADRLNIPREEAKAFIDAYLERFPRVAAFMAATIEQGDRAAATSPRSTAAAGRSPSSRRATGSVRTLGERLAVNTVDPGHRRRRPEAGDDPLRARRCATRDWPPGMVLTVHDELLFEAPEAEADAVEALAAREMAAPWTFEPPLAVDVGSGQELAGREVGRRLTPRRARAAVPGARSPGQRRPQGELRRRDPQVVPEGPVDHAPRVHRAERPRPSAARR